MRTHLTTLKKSTAVLFSALKAGSFKTSSYERVLSAEKRTSSKKLYQWTGYQNTGHPIQGGIEAQNLVAAKDALRKQDILIEKIVRQRLRFTPNKPIKPKDITQFSRQLSTLLDAGIPLNKAFSLINHGHKHTGMRKLIDTIRRDFEGGTPFSKALGKFPIYFNELFCHLVAIGEQSGTMCAMLSSLAEYKENRMRLKRKIIKILTYPLAILCMTLVVLVGLLLIVIPQFEVIYAQFNAPLPSYTQSILIVSRVLQNNWLVLLSLSIGIPYGFIIAKRYSRSFTGFIERGLFKLPVLGTLLKKTIITRFARTLSVTFKAGVPLVASLEATLTATGSPTYSLILSVIKDQVCQGKPLHLAMKNSLLFPEMVIQFVMVGEESASLETMFAKIADYYEADIHHTIEAMSSLLEPLIMALLGLLIGSIIAAIYLPMMNLNAVV